MYSSRKDHANEERLDRIAGHLMTNEHSNPDKHIQHLLPILAYVPRSGRMLFIHIPHNSKFTPRNPVTATLLPNSTYVSTTCSAAVQYYGVRR
jgi:hypothetical protein